MIGINRLGFAPFEKYALEYYCNDRKRETYGLGPILRSYALEIDYVIMQIIAENMCRMDVCPCPSLFESNFLDVEEATFEQFKRTSDIFDTNDDDGSILVYFTPEGEEFEVTYETF